MERCERLSNDCRWKDYSVIIVIVDLASRQTELIFDACNFASVLVWCKRWMKATKIRRRNKHFFKRWRFDWPKRTKWINKYVNTYSERRRQPNKCKELRHHEKLTLKRRLAHRISKTIIQNRFLFWIQMKYSVLMQAFVEMEAGKKADLWDGNESEEFFEKFINLERH